MQPTQRPRFSKAVLKIARANSKEYERQSDEAFLIRAEMNRILDEFF